MSFLFFPSLGFFSYHYIAEADIRSCASLAASSPKNDLEM